MTRLLRNLLPALLLAVFFSVIPAILVSATEETSLTTATVTDTAEVAVATYDGPPRTVEEEIARIPWTMNETYQPPGDPRAIKGGEIRWPINGYPATLRIRGPNSNTTFNSLMEGMCYESLLGMHPETLEWTPALADKWAIMPDNRTFYYHIDSDARWAPDEQFPEGSPVTANDVVESWRFITNPALKAPFYQNYYGTLEPPVALSDSVVKIVSKDDSWRSFMKPSGMVILPAYIIKDMAGSYIEDWQFKFMTGSGPYRFKETVQGREITFERRNDYWAKDKRYNIGVNNFDTFKFIVIADESLQFEMFKKGDLDWYYVNVARRWKMECDFDKVQKGWIQKRKIFTHKPQGISGLALNMRKPPFDDVRVRKAFACMFNREVLIEQLFFNEYLPLHSYFPGGIYENQENEKITYDPDKAVELLKEAGWDKWNSEGKLCKNGVPLEVSLMYADKSSERIWTVVQDYMADIGITFKLKLVTHETQWKLVNEFKFKIVNMAWGGILFPNPIGSYSSMMADRQGSTNICGVKDPQIDEWIEQYDNEHNLQKRVDLIQKIDARLMEIGPFALGWYGPFNRIMYWNRFGHPDFYLSRFGDYRSIASYWWIDPEKEKVLAAAQASNSTLPSGETNVNYWQEWSKKQKTAAPQAE